MQKLKVLNPFYKKDTLICNALTIDGTFGKIKFLSSIYPFNSTVVASVKGYFKPDKDFLKGFRPLSGIIDTVNLAWKINMEFPIRFIPPEKFNSLRRLIILCNNNKVKIAVFISPIYQTSENLDRMMKQIKTATQQYKDVYFLDYSRNKTFYMQTNLFEENFHLNHLGAKLFSEIISNEFKSILSQ